MARVSVLRIGHRLVRDDRVTTHVALTARAFGADRVFIVGGEDHIREKVDDLIERWGGNFEVKLVEDWKSIVGEWKHNGGLVVHLTMYGLDIDAVESIRRLEKDVLVVIGAEKVPRGIYSMADYNLSVGHQPHSEISALAVFLDRYFQGEELKRAHPGGKFRVLPSARGKSVQNL